MVPSLWPQWTAELFPATAHTVKPTQLNRDKRPETRQTRNCRRITSHDMPCRVGVALAEGLALTSYSLR